jgi:hypothetical protein
VKLRGKGNQYSRFRRPVWGPPYFHHQNGAELQQSTLFCLPVQCDNQRMAAGLQRRNSMQSQLTNSAIDAATGAKDRSCASLAYIAHWSRCDTIRATPMERILKLLRAA